MKIFLGAGTTKIVAPLFLCVCLPFLFLALLDRTAEEWQETEWERMTCSTGGTGRTTTTTTTSLFIFLPFVWLHCIERLKSDREQDVREGMAARDARGPRAPETWASHYLLRIHFLSHLPPLVCLHLTTLLNTKWSISRGFIRKLKWETQLLTCPWACS